MWWEEPEKEYTLDEVAAHNKRNDCWVIIGEINKGGGPKVYDVSEYLDDHPGGADILLEHGGGDATARFEDVGHSRSALEEVERHKIGKLKVDPEEWERRRKAKEEEAATAAVPREGSAARR